MYTKLSTKNDVRKAYCSRFGKASSIGSTSSASRPENARTINNNGIMHQKIPKLFFVLNNFLSIEILFHELP